MIVLVFWVSWRRPWSIMNRKRQTIVHKQYWGLLGEIATLQAYSVYPYGTGNMTENRPFKIADICLNTSTSGQFVPHAIWSWIWLIVSSIMWFIKLGRSDWICRDGVLFSGDCTRGHWFYVPKRQLSPTYSPGRVDYLCALSGHLASIYLLNQLHSQHQPLTLYLPIPLG